MLPPELGGMSGGEWLSTDWNALPKRDRPGGIGPMELLEDAELVCVRAAVPSIVLRR